MTNSTPTGPDFDPDAEHSKTYSTAEVSEMFGVTNETVRNWAKSGHLEAFRLPSGRLRFHRPALVRFGSTRYASRPQANNAPDSDLI